MHPDTLAVFTANTIEEILETGGSGAWVLNEPRARRCRYLVCIRNGKIGSEGPEPHGSAFLVGRINDIRSAGRDAKDQKRWTIMLREYALIAIPILKEESWRNPVKYTSLAELGISIEGVQFAAVPEPKRPPAKASDRSVRPLTLAEAKEGLALGLGIAPEKIEILIRA